ncbi:hypothetical protein AYO20_07367 [Fonsecaea nubica]|uniref:NB-ARC domain-containing protein n=1 Tax=Fonsecaea nubica TaxID=856822 RepID=A0A178CV71_9EURO|nr:hypothetical protein AYO20_07367 [Fonsecaea nubica]OAL33356.1 hypothetical protein AYO20_07367 [Fonsecaea nubica]
MRFVGREEVINALRQQLFTSDAGNKVSLVGLGGVGKTQVAFQIAYWTKEHKPDHSVFWVSAMSGASFEQAYTEMSNKLAVRKSSEDKDVRESVRRWLESDESGKWLLVVDHADDMDVLFGSLENPDGIFQYLPERDHGRILFTTRSREVANAVEGEMVELAEMSADEAKSLLEKSLEKSLVREDLLRNDKGVAELLQELTYLPLAIMQAAAYLNRNRVTITKYMELLRGTEQDMVRLISREFHDSTRPRGSRHAVATTWLVSFHQIRQSDPAAADLLMFLSCIDPKAVPQSILPLFPTEEAMVFALGTLDAYTFVVRRGNSNTFDTHSLVHSATRIWVREEGIAARVEESAVQYVTSVFPSSDYSQRDRWREYLPHAFRLLRRDDTIDLGERYDLCIKVGQCLQVDGRIKEAVRCFQECYDWRRAHLNEDHPSRLASQHALAGAYKANGQVKDAVTLLEEVVRIRAQTLAEDHPDRLASQRALAGVYEANGQVKEAMRLLEEVVQIEERTLAEDHPDRLASQHELAIAYRANGQVKEAVRLLEEVVQIEERTLAEDHPDRLASQHALAMAYQANGQVKEAVTLLEEVVRIRGQTQAEDHPSRLASQHELAIAYQANGQVKETVTLLEEVVQIKEQTLAEDHPDRLASQHALAMAYQANGQVKEAVRLLEEVVQIEERTLAEDHPSRLASQYALAIAYRANGQVKEAVTLLEEVIWIRGETPAEDHPDRLASQRALAMAYEANGQVKEAVRLLEEVVRVEERTLAEDHPDRLASQHALAGVYQANGQVEEAVSLMRHVIKIREQALTKERFPQSVGSPMEDDQSDGNLSEVSSGPPSLTSASTDDSTGDEYGQAVEHLVEIFCSDSNIGPVYREATRQLGARKFSQNHDQLLKLYFRGLRHEVKNGTELATTRLLRTRRYRNEITSLILTSVELLEVGQGRLTPITLAGRKTERNYNLNQFIRSLTIPDYYDNHEEPLDEKQLVGGDVSEDLISESDGSSTEPEHESSGDKQSPLQAIDSFLTGGRAFNQLQINLTSLLRPPHALKDALQSKSEFVVKQSIARIIDGQPCKDRETILELRKQNLSVTEIARVLLGNALALPLEIAEDQKPTLAENTMTSDAYRPMHDATFTKEKTPIIETAVTKSKLDNLTESQVSQFPEAWSSCNSVYGVSILNRRLLGPVFGVASSFGPPQDRVRRAPIKMITTKLHPKTHQPE